MYQDGKIILGKTSDGEAVLYPQMANRHGLIAGATGTGKTTTVKAIAESFSDAGVSVFLADVKGDLSGIAVNSDGSASDRTTGLWDLYTAKGMPLRTTVTEVGPILLSRILDLNQTQQEVLDVIFRIADEEGLLLIDTKDLKAMINHVSELSADYAKKYGTISSQTLTTILRAVTYIEDQGGDRFFGEPAINISDWFGHNVDGKGNVQILDCQQLILNPTMYSTMMLWLLSEIYEILPEVGDLPKPRMVFFFDEAHLLFDNAGKHLLDKVEQVVKLIRSKGVGVYFITQSPRDIPDGVLAQLGNKIQHALHAYTPAEQKALKAAADSFRVNPEFKTFDVLQELQIGEALVSVLDESGVPTIVERTKIGLPACSLGAVDDATREYLIKSNDLYLKYCNAVDRDSAYEFFERMALVEEKAAVSDERVDDAIGEGAVMTSEESEAEAKKRARLEYANAHKVSNSTGGSKQGKKTSKSDKKDDAYDYARTHKSSNKVMESVAKTAAGTVGREMGNSIGKSIGGSFGKRLGGNVGATLARGIIGNLCR